MYKIFSKFFLEYTTKRLSFYFLVGIHFIASVIILSIVSLNIKDSYSNEIFVNNTLIFAAPSLIWIFISITFSVFQQFSKTKANGLELYMISKPISKIELFWIKTVTSLIITFSYLGIFIIFQTILVSSIIGIWSNVIISSISILLGSILIFFVYYFILAFIGISYKYITSLSLIFFSTSILITASLIQLVIKPISNELSWNVNSNVINYAEILNVDDNGNILESNIASYSTTDGTQNKDTKENAIRKTQFYNSNYNPFYLLSFNTQSIYSLYLNSNNRINNMNQYELSKHNYNNSLINRESKIGKTVSTIDVNKNNLIALSPNSSNPFSLSYSEYKNVVIEAFKHIENNSNFDFANESQVLINKLKNEPIWSRITLTTNELELIKMFSGYIKETSNLFNLQNNWMILENKYKNIFDDMSQLFSKELSEVGEYLITDRVAYDNSVNTTFIATLEEKNNLFPMLGYKNVNQEASYIDLKTMKELIIYNNSKFRIKTSTGIFNDFDVSVLFPNLNNDQDWINFIDNNNELVNIESYYESIKREFNLQHPSDQIYNIVFSNNATDIYLLDTLIEFESNILLTFLTAILSQLTLISWMIYLTHKKLRERDVS